MWGGFIIHTRMEPQSVPKVYASEYEVIGGDVTAAIAAAMENLTLKCVKGMWHCTDREPYLSIAKYLADTMKTLQTDRFLPGPSIFIYAAYKNGGGRKRGLAPRD